MSPLDVLKLAVLGAGVLIFLIILTLRILTEWALITREKKLVEDAWSLGLAAIITAITLNVMKP